MWQCLDLEDGGNIMLRNFDRHLCMYAVLQYSELLLLLLLNQLHILFLNRG
jgi:hypothetical protein